MHDTHLPAATPEGMLCIMNLARIRELRGLNQRQLAEMVGVDQSTIQRAETAHPSAKLATYKRCADALRVSLSDIFADDRSAIELELLSVFRNVPADRREALIAALRLAQSQTNEEAK